MKDRYVWSGSYGEPPKRVEDDKDMGPVQKPVIPAQSSRTKKLMDILGKRKRKHGKSH